ncbi:MAG: ribonuclease P protein component [Bacteroidales bacterium]|nr:ribonuclease P protein component [Bacteroidales bacterium]
MDNGLSKSEIISGKNAVNVLMNQGHWGVCENLKYCWLLRKDGEGNRIMVSVPKRNFKRAVKRNLLKRRLRESYRTQKKLLPASADADILFFYNTKEILDSETIRGNVAKVLEAVAAKAKQQEFQAQPLKH